MDISKKLKTTQTIAIILGILLIIVTVLWVHAAGYFTLGAEDLAAQRNKIAEVCGSADELQTEECRDALNDLARLLGRFNDDLKDNKDAASTTTP